MTRTELEAAIDARVVARDTDVDVDDSATLKTVDIPVLITMDADGNVDKRCQRAYLVKPDDWRLGKAVSNYTAPTSVVPDAVTIVQHLENDASVTTFKLKHTGTFGGVDYAMVNVDGTLKAFAVIGGLVKQIDAE